MKSDRIIFVLIPLGTGKPVLQLQYYTVNHVQQKSAEKNNFHNFNDHIGAHKMGRFVKGFPGVCQYQAQVNAQMHQQENDQEESGQGHHQFFSD